MPEVRYLTKSRFKLACECPAKLFYTKNPEYADQKIDDAFLIALADGGFQVGELAKCLFPGGTDIETLDYDDSVARTDELLKAEHAVIFEAAIRYGNYFIRIDVLVKNGVHFDLIEVKSKSFDPDADSFKNKNGTIASCWKPYLFDVAFQKFVLQGAFPDSTVSGFLMMADRSVQCPTDGLNQKFRVVTDGSGRKRVITLPLTPEDLSPPVLCRINVDDLCEQIYSGPDGVDDEGRSFAERAAFYAERYALDEKIVTEPSAACKKCEFKTTPEDEAEGKLSGYRECWAAAYGWGDDDFAEPTVLDIWNYHHLRKKKRFEERRVKIADLVEDDLAPKKDGRPGLSQSERQWLQVQKARANDASLWIDSEGLRREMDSWTFPLHFIDFETSMAAIPFNKGRRPYEAIAFQFSHHVVFADGRVVHQGEFLNTDPGVFPNYEFLRALSRELDSDAGSIFRYAEHENSYLNMIYRQILDDPHEIPDRDELLAFIRQITRSSKEQVEQWEGERNMIDLCHLVRRYYYDPRTGGSNSIKQVLPAILNNSEFLQERYSRPIYGADDGIPSFNFRDWTWIESQNGTVTDPYKRLPKMFDDIPDDELELISGFDELNEGGAAMTAYGRLQYEDMSDYERSEIKKALLKYCELDTLAMVMIYEGWREMLR
jgi:hypothetical protein